MRSMTRKLFFSLTFLVGLFLVSPGLFAQADAVFFSGPDNQISLADFSTVPPTVGVVISVNGSKFRGFKVLGDGRILVANATQGGGVQICVPGAVGWPPSLPHPGR